MTTTKLIKTKGTAHDDIRDEDFVDFVASDYNRGVTIPKIAKKCGLSLPQLSYRLRRMRKLYPEKFEKKFRFTKAEHWEWSRIAREMWDEGATYREIAPKYKINEKALSVRISHWRKLFPESFPYRQEDDRELAEQIQALYISTSPFYTISDIAKKLGMTTRYISVFISRKRSKYPDFFKPEDRGYEILEFDISDECQGRDRTILNLYSRGYSNEVIGLYINRHPRTVNKTLTAARRIYPNIPPRRGHSTRPLTPEQLLQVADDYNSGYKNKRFSDFPRLFMPRRDKHPREFIASIFDRIDGKDDLKRFANEYGVHLWVLARSLYLQVVCPRRDELNSYMLRRGSRLAEGVKSLFGQSVDEFRRDIGKFKIIQDLCEER